MSHTSLILSALFTMAMLVLIAPTIVAFNRGHVLRNIAIWLALFTGLGLIYQTFGPDSAHPLFQLPEAMGGMKNGPAENKTPPGLSDKDGKDDGEQGFIPPKE